MFIAVVCRAKTSWGGGGNAYRLDNLRYVHTMEYFTAIKTNEIDLNMLIWKALQVRSLNKIVRFKTIYINSHIYKHMCGHICVYRYVIYLYMYIYL